MKMTESASEHFRRVFAALDYPDDVAVRFGTRATPEGLAEYVDFVLLGSAGAGDVVHHFHGVRVIVGAGDAGHFADTVVDYVSDPSGFVFKNNL